MFLSYAREDSPCARQLMDALADERIDCVADPELVEGDPFWRESVAAGAAGCALMVGLVSRHGLASPWVEQEQRAFAGPRLRVLIDPAVADAVGPARSAEFVQLDDATAVIRAALPRVRPPARLSPVPPAGTVAADRQARALQAEAALVQFQSALPHLPRPRVAFDDDVARVGEGFMTLRRTHGTGHGAWIGVTPVTNAQYRAFLRVSGYPDPPTWTRTAFRLDEAPVTGITWFEALAFAQWVGGTLPTEEDWVNAARGDDPARMYATANGTLSRDLACFAQAFGAAAPVVATAYPPNAEGFYGMCGNTWDWSASAWGAHRVILGGGAMDAPRFCAIAARYRNAPIDRDCCVGFRVKIPAGPHPSPQGDQS